MKSALVLLFAAVILLGAFLSFEIQPLVGKIVTAGFGGSAAIWGVCLLFFQIALLGGYTLTCLLTKLTLRSQSIVYILIVISSAVSLNLPGPAGWNADTQGDVAQTLLIVLAAHLAFPCLILSSISGMMQTWFSISRLGNPYPLYSLSNIGSLGALLAYPLLIEPALLLTKAIVFWRASYFLLAFLVCLVALYILRHNFLVATPPVPLEAADGEKQSFEVPERLLQQNSELSSPEPKASNSGPAPMIFNTQVDNETQIESHEVGSQEIGSQHIELQHIESQQSRKPGLREFTWWILLSSMGTLALVSYTAYLTQDIAPVPLIYVIPLCLYLSSFIIAFAGEQFYKRAVLVYLTPLLWILDSCIATFWLDKTLLFLSMAWSIISVLAFMFCFFLTCQGELYRSRPAAKHLASFYLAIAFGGTLGGLFVNFAAPVLFTTYMERYIVGAFTVLLWITIASTYHRRQFVRMFNGFYGALAGGSLIFLMGAGTAGYSKAMCQKRNFFGCLTVSAKSKYVALNNGRIMHGKQYIADAQSRRLPTLYFSRGTGLDLIDFNMRKVQNGKPLKYGLIGLGAGTIAAYGKPGDSFIYYEIDPKVIACAQKYFSFLSDSLARITIIPGDARAELKKQPPQNFNLLVVDAFNGDAIPVHLLTKEALNIYFSHLVPDGILLVHVTNRFIDLEPVLGNLAEAMSLNAFALYSVDANYIAISRSHEFKPSLPDDPELGARFAGLQVRPVKSFSAIGIWTDDYSNLFATMLAKWQRKGD